MTRDTSLAAYQQLRHLNSKQQSVLVFVHGHPNCSDRDIAEGLGWTINRVTPRRGEIEKLGLIVSVGVKVQNGRKTHTWKVKT